MRQE
jgi:hypothetical protein